MNQRKFSVNLYFQRTSQRFSVFRVKQTVSNMGMGSSLWKWRIEAKKNQAGSFEVYTISLNQGLAKHREERPDMKNNEPPCIQMVVS